MTTSPASTDRQPRMEGIDALRAVAMLLGVVLHAAVAYMPSRMPHLAWAVRDEPSGPWLDWLFWWIHAFRMPVFFLIGGFFAAMLLQRQNTQSFLVNRARRLLIPLFALGFFLLPLIYAIWCGGWLLSGLCNTGQVLRLKFVPELQAELYGPAHLWFLEYLFLLGAGYCGWRWLSERILEPESSQALVERLELALRSPWKSLWFALPSAMLLWLNPDAVIGMHQSFLPDFWRFSYSACFFAAGVGLFRLRDSLNDVLQGSFRELLLSLPVMLVAGCLLGQHLQDGSKSWDRLTMAVSLSLVAWLTTFGLMGLFLRLPHVATPAVRYLGKASYWIYLVHFPLVALLQVLLYMTSVPPIAKFLMTASAATLLGILSYELLVRNRWLGDLLAGKLKWHAFRDLLRPRPAASRNVAWQWTVARQVLVASVLCAVGFMLWTARNFLFQSNRHVVIAGEVYRSGQASAARLSQWKQELNLKAIVSLQPGSRTASWFPEQQRLCQESGVEFHVCKLDGDYPPGREELQSLVNVLKKCQRPVLLEGRFGFGRTGLASAVALLLADKEPIVAREQFSFRYGILDRTPRAAERVLVSYQDWLSDRQEPHSADLFCWWVNHVYAPATSPYPMLPPRVRIFQDLAQADESTAAALRR